MDELKNVRSLKIEVGDQKESLLNVLKIALKPWLENGCDLDTDNIELLLCGYQFDPHIEPESGEMPCLYLRPKRNGINYPSNKELKPINFFRDWVYQTLPIDIKFERILEQTTKYLCDDKFIQVLKLNYRCGNKKGEMAQGDAYCDSFIVEFSTSYENSFFRISLSSYTTLA